MKDGHFDAVALNEGALPDIARELETCHPTIFLGKGDLNAAWIEGFHPRDSIHAYDVEYISPLAMKLSPSARDTFRSYANKLDAVLENSHSLVYMDEPTASESCFRRQMETWLTTHVREIRESNALKIQRVKVVQRGKASKPKVVVRRRSTASTDATGDLKILNIPSFLKRQAD